MVVGTTNQRDGLPTSCCTWVGKLELVLQQVVAPVLVVVQQGLGLEEVEGVVDQGVVALVVQVDLGDLGVLLVQVVMLELEVRVGKLVCTGLALEVVSQLEALCSFYRKVVGKVEGYILA